MFIVYKHTNIHNGKAYVGYTKHSIEYRWRKHCGYSRWNANKVFHRAIHKYGEASFSHEVLGQYETDLEAKAAEIQFIAQYGTCRPNGYNMTFGGEGILGYVHTPEAYKKGWRKLGEWRPTTESRERMRASAMGNRNRPLGCRNSKEHNHRISLSKKGKSNGRLGIKHSRETLLKMRLSQQARRLKERISLE